LSGITPGERRNDLIGEGSRAGLCKGVGERKKKSADSQKKKPISQADVSAPARGGSSYP